MRNPEKKKKRHRNGYKGMPHTCKGNIQEIITSNKKKNVCHKNKTIENRI